MKIKITLPDGSVKEFAKGITPQEIAEQLGKQLSRDALAAKVNGKMIDLTQPLTEDCELRILTFDDEEGQIEATVASDYNEGKIKPGETYTIIITAAGVTTTEKYTAI